MCMLGGERWRKEGLHSTIHRLACRHTRLALKSYDSQLGNHQRMGLG